MEERIEGIKMHGGRNGGNEDAWKENYRID